MELHAGFVFKYMYNIKTRTYVHNKCIVPNNYFKCKYIVGVGKIPVDTINENLHFYI